MAVSGAQTVITQAVLAWEGASVTPHRFGGVEFLLGKREIGHIHGDHLVDIPFPTKLRDEVVATGQAEPHHLLVDSGWVSFYIRGEGDVDRVIALLRRSYDLAANQRRQRGGG